MVLTDGKTYDIRHPDMLLVTRRLAITGTGGDSEAGLPESAMWIDPLHIIRTEQIPAKSGSKNGRKKH
jgi:hypothetical protein